MTIRVIAAMIAIACFGNTAAAQSFRNQDTAIGGLAGAVIGGIIGHQNDETPEGALIGGAVGAVAGRLIGDAKDQQLTRQHQYEYQARRYYQQQRSRAVTGADVVQMSRSGLSNSVIINHIRAHGIVQPVGTQEIISLHHSGVSEAVISAMQHAQVIGQTRSEPVIVRTAPPVIVREEVRVVPTYRHHLPPRRLRYATRPAFPTYPSRVHFHSYW